MMKRNYLLSVAMCAAAVLSAAAASAEDVSLTYALAIDRPETGLGRVTMQISGLETKGFRLLRSSSAEAGWFDAVKVYSPAAPDKPYELVPVEGGYYVTTDGARSVTVDYIIKPGEIGDYGHLGLITSDFAALDGAFIFLLPGDEQNISDAVLKVTVPPAWRPVTSWQESSGALRPDPALAPLRDQLGRSLLCFGDFAATKKPVGTNTLVLHIPAAYPQKDAADLAATLTKVYTAVYDAIGFETGREYSVVCLPPAPDGVPIVAGAWADGQAFTITGKFTADEVFRNMKLFGRLISMGYFSETPLGVKLGTEDAWLYPAVAVYCEGLSAIAADKTSENFFYAQLYSDYSDEASQDYSNLDVPMRDLDRAPADTRAFLSDLKAPVLLMRLDFEIRSNTSNAQTVQDFLKALYKKGHNRAEGTRALDVLAAMTSTDFDPFYQTFVRKRTLILPTWPAFLDGLSTEKAEPGPVAADVNGVPVYEREVQIMSDAILSEGQPVTKGGERESAITALINEKLTDEALFARKMNVVPKEFWDLRLVLPPRVMQILLTRKRQALKDALYSEWFTDTRNAAKVEIMPAPKPKPPQPEGPSQPAPPAQQDTGMSLQGQ